MSPAGASSRSPRAASRADATTSEVRDILTAMVDVVLSSGGHLHPGLRLVEHDGDMTVLCELGEGDGGGAAPSSGGLLFDVPRELLIPVTGAEWADERTELRLLAPPPVLTPLQLDVLDLHIALYNATDRIPWPVSCHPRAALVDQPQIVAAFQALRPGFGQECRPPAETFLSTRVFGLGPDEAPNRTGAGNDLAVGEEGAPASADPSASGEAQPAKTSELMILIDLLNHHPRGAPYEVDARSMTSSVTRAGGTDECVATYGGRRDVIDLAMEYGYVDRNTHLAHCAAVEVEVGGFGRVRVLGQRLPKRTPLDPPTVRLDDDVLVLSHLTFAQAKPVAFHTPLRMAVQGAALQRGMDPAVAARAADEAADAIVQANLDLLDAIVEAASVRTGVRTAARGGRGSEPPAATDAAPAVTPALALMADAAETQSAIIRSVAASRVDP